MRTNAQEHRDICRVVKDNIVHLICRSGEESYQHTLPVDLPKDLLVQASVDLFITGLAVCLSITASLDHSQIGIYACALNSIADFLNPQQGVKAGTVAADDLRIGLRGGLALVAQKDLPVGHVVGIYRWEA